MNETLSALCYIQEQTSYPEDIEDFGYKVHDKGNRFYLTFDGTLQSFGVLNRNRRAYDAANIMDRIEHDDYIQSMLKQQSWLGEIDHPSPAVAGQDLTANRICNPDPKMSSHFIRKPRLEGNLLKAPIQTDSSNENGMNMAIKIVDGKIVPAFSARVLGELINKLGLPTVMVKRLITYDWVLYPSHKEALANIKPGIIEESVDMLEQAFGGKVIFLSDLAQMAANSSRETEWLCESFGLTMDNIIGVTNTGNSVVIQENKNIYAQPISDKLIRNQTKNTLSDFFGRRV
jgi:hypothetical protein